MSMKEYEAIIIGPPDLGEEATSKIQGQFAEIVSRNGGQMVSHLVLGKRRLSYKIGRQAEGAYIQFRFQISPDKVGLVRKAASMAESVLRVLVIQATAGGPTGPFEESSEGRHYGDRERGSAPAFRRPRSEEMSDANKESF